jgi:homoserine kinase
VRLVGGGTAGGDCAGGSLWQLGLELGADSGRGLSALEGHPDNAAACWLGGFVAAACEGDCDERRTLWRGLSRLIEWRAIVVLPTEPLATSKARAVLPDCYPLNDVVANIQSVALLGLAFAQERGDLLRTAMQDRIHQPYRAPICTLLPPLLAGGERMGFWARR